MNKNQIRNSASQAVLFTAFLIGMAGCGSTPQVVGPSPSPNAQRVTIGPGLKGKIVIAGKIKDRESSAGLKEVVVPIRNTTSNAIEFNYKIEWYDVDDFEAGNTPRWRRKTVQGYDETLISDIAKGVKAVKYKVILKKNITE